MIICAHVFAGSTPKHSFRRDSAFRVSLNNSRVFLFGNSPPRAHKSGPGYSHLKPGAELFLWKIALDPPSLSAVRLLNENSRRPKHVEAFEISGIFLDVHLQRNEVLVDKGCNFIVGVGFGFQPNTGSSARRGAEINYQQFVLRFSLSERRVRIFYPLNVHRLFPLIDWSQN
jgi:hypothetical protein